jgi:hypothetical protein
MEVKIAGSQIHGTECSDGNVGGGRFQGDLEPEQHGYRPETKRNRMRLSRASLLNQGYREVIDAD